MQAKDLYILGDLFDNFWLGNDDHLEPSPDIIAELKDYTSKGKSLYIIKGNRELMLDKGIEALTGARLLPDLYVIDLYGNNVLIAHGDVLCAKDRAYQFYRTMMELRFVRWFFLSLPYPLRLLLVNGIRPLMRDSVKRKAPEIIDVDDKAVTETMLEYKVQEMIHGHTHRPDKHTFDLKGETATRIVLGDWHKRDSVLVCDKNKRTLMSVQDYIDSMEFLWAQERTPCLVQPLTEGHNTQRG